MGWVCETGNVLKDYNFPGMLGKMHACVVSVYQALSKKEESLGTRLDDRLLTKAASVMSQKMAALVLVSMAEPQGKWF